METDVTVGRAGLFRLGRVLALYRACFDRTQQLRSVAYSPLLFRAFYASLMLRGKCRMFLARRGGTPVGFAITRADAGPGAPWLLSAIGVLPDARGTGVASALFAAASKGRVLRLTVEEGGAVGFYETLPLDRTGERTLVYLQEGQLQHLREIPTWADGSAAAPEGRAVNRASYLITIRAPDMGVEELAIRKLKRFEWVILELPGRVDVPSGRFPTVVHELEFTSRPA
jgi:ribosomal protein S18 acetylase RimI-like enzyme